MQTWTNERGNEVMSYQPGEYPGRPQSRYFFDTGPCASDKGWRQYDTDQDAHYFGVWVHLESRQTITYAEGDVIVVSCPTRESFRAELEDAERVYGAPPPAFVSYDADGTRTEYYDERPTV